MAFMKDKYFANQMKEVAPFSFNEEVAEVFDDMISRSVPFYDETMQMLVGLSRKSLRPNDRVYDLGCSTASTLLRLHLELKDLNLQFIGIDQSAPMIEKATAKLKSYQATGVELKAQDILTTSFESSGLFILNYTLQFIHPDKRLELLKNIYSSLRPGGMLFMAEKIKADDESFQKTITDLYYDFKRTQGYSELEISQKREALENVLIPLSPEAEMSLLKKAGFESCEMMFRWYNFAAFIAFKKG